MTPRRATLADTGLPAAWVARQWRRSERTIQYWLDGRTAPAGFDGWLAELAQWLRDNAPRDY